MGPIELLVGALITVVAGVAAGYAMYFIHRHFSKSWVRCRARKMETRRNPFAIVYRGDIKPLSAGIT